MTQKHILTLQKIETANRSNYMPTKEEFKIMSKSIKRGLIISLVLKGSILYLYVEIYGHKPKTLPTPVLKKEQTWRVINAYKHFYEKLHK